MAIWYTWKIDRVAEWFDGNNMIICVSHFRGCVFLVFAICGRQLCVRHTRLSDIISNTWREVDRRHREQNVAVRRRFISIICLRSCRLYHLVVRITAVFVQLNCPSFVIHCWEWIFQYLKVFSGNYVYRLYNGLQIDLHIFHQVKLQRQLSELKTIVDLYICAVIDYKYTKITSRNNILLI